jgi:hypothetical protein
VARPAGLLSGLLRRGLREGLRRGVLGGERTWLILGGVALLAQLAVRALHKKSQVVFSERLGPGQSLVISHRPRGDQP